jgi:flagellar protein FliS
MLKQGYAAYQHSITHTTQRKEEILLMLYDGAIRFIRLAKRGIEERRIACKGESLSKAIAIILEMDIALDHELGGEMTADLSRLYRYMVDRLTHANIHDDISALDEVINLSYQLKESFESALQMVKAEKSSIVTPPISSGGLSVAI